MNVLTLNIRILELLKDIYFHQERFFEQKVMVKTVKC